MILSIITGTYNRLPYLQDMMKTAKASLPPNWICGLEYEFVVCDGGSTDGTLEWLRTQEGVTIIEHGELRGAIAAFNSAGAAAKGDYVVPANDDIEFIGLTLARGIAFMQDNPEVGAGCFYQDRSGKDWHVEYLPVQNADGSGSSLPYPQVAIIPRWLWDTCGGWGDWGGKTYGGDCYLGGKIWESGYKCVAIEGCKIHDRVLEDDLRKRNYRENNGSSFWDKFKFKISDTPLHKNPLPAVKRVLYAPIIEKGHDVQKAQKRGLRDALASLGPIWEVDYIYSGESVKNAAEAWAAHYILTQFHTASATSPEEVLTLRATCQGYMMNFAGDVWSDQATPEILEMLRQYDLQLTVNAALLPRYAAAGIRAVYWQNSFEPQVIDNALAGTACDVLFLGNCYHVQGVKLGRLELAQSLKSIPYSVHVYGRGYPDGLAEGESLYDYRKTGQLYRGARIGVADNQYYEARGFFSDRAFMILAAGGCLMLHQEVDGMEELAGFKDGVHYVSWKTKEDLNAKIAYYLEHEEERARIAWAGTEECRLYHSFEARVRALGPLLSQIPRRTGSVSALLIVKDEEKNIEACLQQLRWANEIVVVDTGSTDWTATYLASLVGTTGWPQLRVYHFPWVDDFSAARNFAKSKATSEWVFWCDADDRLPEKTISRLAGFRDWSFRSIGIQNPGAFKFWVESGDQGVFQTRLFKNIPLIEWRKRVQETVDESLMEMGVTTVAMNAVKVEHLVAAPEVILAKQWRNLRLLKLEAPSPWRSYQVAASYAAMERWGDAVIHFELAWRETTDAEFKSFLSFAAGYALYKMDLEELAITKFKQSEFPDALFLRAELEDSPALYSQFLNTPLPSLFPTFSRAWRPVARERLLTWHRKELALLEA